MMTASPPCTVLVIGAGIMGTGIGQVAAQAGHEVRLFDTRDDAATEAKTKLGTGLAALAAKGKVPADTVAATLARIQPIAALEQSRDAGLVIEAIVENLDAKRTLLRQIEGLVGADCMLASNTSSISITALANGLQRPERLVGMHFFNPAPVMKLVEVVSGLHTAPAVAKAAFTFAERWGKTPVHARSTPGFIVNRIARPYYGEAQALLHERAATPPVLDVCLRAVGFRMGPCELIDLVGQDVNLAVTESVYQANFGDKRYMPSLLQREMVEGGLLGRKSGRGFYDYRNGVPAAPAPVLTEGEPVAVPSAALVFVHGKGPVAEHWAQALGSAGVFFDRKRASDWSGLEADGAQLRVTDGRSATRVSAETGVREIALMDLPIAPFAAGAALAFSVARTASPTWADHAPAWLRLAGFTPHRVGDAAGLIAARTIAMLINEAADAVQQGVCSEEAADTAMKLGLNFPAGPFEWLSRWDVGNVVQLLDYLDEEYRGERYRVSPELRERAWCAAVVDGRR